MASDSKGSANDMMALLLFGLAPKPEDLDTVRKILRAQIEREQKGQGRGDGELMKLACVQLFNGGEVEDALAIWRAKTASEDADASLDVRLLCGAGLEQTKAYLASLDADEARAALSRISKSEASGHFAKFTLASYSAWWTAYYEDDATKPL
jgi:hypothetical protein